MDAADFVEQHEEECIRKASEEISRRTLIGWLKFSKDMRTNFLDHDPALVFHGVGDRTVEPGIVFDDEE
jgi:hypothetical protein